MMWVGCGRWREVICRGCKLVAKYIDGCYLCVWSEYDFAVDFASILVGLYPLPFYWEWEGGGKVDCFRP